MNAETDTAVAAITTNFLANPIFVSNRLIILEDEVTGVDHKVVHFGDGILVFFARLRAIISFISIYLTSSSSTTNYLLDLQFEFIVTTRRTAHQARGVRALTVNNFVLSQRV